MSVNITGLNQLLADVEQRLGPNRMTEISDRALLLAVDVYILELKRQFETFKDTGASINEITHTEPYTKNGVRTVTVHWRGPKSRYRVIHLNEFGTVKTPNPRGKGAVARSLQVSRNAYRQAIENSLRNAL